MPLSSDRLFSRGRATALTFLLLLGFTAQLPAATAAGSSATFDSAFGRLPLAFEPNLGQSAPAVRYLARGPRYALALSDRGATLRLPGGDGLPLVVGLELVGASPDLALATEEPLPGHSNYVTLGGPDGPRDVPHFGRVRYRQVYPGVDLVFYGRQGELEYDFELSAGADPGVLALRLRGGHSARLDEAGDLVIETGGEPLRFRAPVSYQVAGDERRSVASRYRLDGTIVRFVVGDHDPGLPLVVDPVLVFSTYLGGGGAATDQEVRGVAVGSGGEVYATGVTQSDEFPLQGAGTCDDELNDQTSFNSCNGSASLTATDAFVTKLNALGTALLYSTYLGGSLSEVGNAIAVDSAGVAYVVGYQGDPLAGGQTNQAFFVKLDTTTGAAVYASVFGQTPPGGYVGYDYNDQAMDIAIDTSGNAYVVGFTSSPSFIPAGVPGVDQVYGTNGSNGDGDAFLQIWNSANQVTASTYMGGVMYQDAVAVRRAGDGRIFATGTSYAVDNVLGDPYLIVVNSTATAVSASLLFQGTNGQDTPRDLALDSTGRAWVVGVTSSSDFCTGYPGLDGTFGGPIDGLAFRVNAALTDVDYCTYVGGVGCQEVRAAALASDAKIVLVGASGTDSGDCDGVYPDTGNSYDAFVLRLDAAANSLDWSYVLSDTGTPDAATAVAVGPTGGVVFGGLAGGDQFPVTPGAFATTYPFTVKCGFVSKLDPTTTLSVADTSVNEGAGSASFTVSLNGTPLDTVGYTYGTANGTATAGQDYTATSGTAAAAFSPLGPSSVTRTVSITNDTLDESDETFVLNLSAPVNATLADSQGQATIVDNDAPPTLSITDASVAEGVTAQFTVSLSAASGKTVTVNWAAANGTATSPADYAAGNGTLTFAAGTTSKTITRATVDDSLDEANETFVVNLSAPANATLADSQGQATITDNDSPPSMAISDATVTEGETAQFTVSLSAASGKTITANWAAANGTATSPADYAAGSGTLTFNPGTTSVPITRTTVDDSTPESTETFVINLSVPVNVTLADAQGQCTITDNDPSLIFSDGFDGGSSAAWDLTTP